MSDLNMDYDNNDAESDIIGKDGEKWLTWSDFWEEIAEARQNCVNEYTFKDVIKNIIKYYNVCLTVDSIEY